MLATITIQGGSAVHIPSFMRPRRVHSRHALPPLPAVAGVGLHEAPRFWRRMAAENPGSINSNHAASHPATSYRFLALEKTVQEIAEKQRNHQPLVPEKKAPAEEQRNQ